VTALGWPHDLMSLAEFDVLATDTTRWYELQEGIPHVTPLPRLYHQLAVFQLMKTLDSQLPPGWRMLHAATVVTDPDHPVSVRRPDIVVVPTDIAGTKPPRFAADEVRFAIEVISLGTHGTDTVTKPFEYAKAGIVDYWVVDVRPPVSLTAYRLGDDRKYQKRAAVTATFTSSEPFALTVDLSELPTSPESEVDQ
jgi:Uma2 family endonuclease